MKSSATFSSVNPSTLSQIKAGSTTKKKLGSSATTRTVQGKAGKFAITETSHKFEESGVAKKKKLCYVPIKIRNRKTTRFNPN